MWCSWCVQTTRNGLKNTSLAPPTPPSFRHSHHPLTKTSNCSPPATTPSCQGALSGGGELGWLRAPPSIPSPSPPPTHHSPLTSSCLTITCPNGLVFEGCCWMVLVDGAFVEGCLLVVGSLLWVFVEGVACKKTSQSSTPFQTYLWYPHHWGLENSLLPLLCV